MKKTLLAPIIVLFSIAAIFLENCKKPDDVFYMGDNHRVIEPEKVDSLAFTDAEINLIMEGDSADLMRVLTIHTITTDTITNYEDSLFLRQISMDVRADSTDTVLLRLIDRLYTTVMDPNHPGIGIAAPQVGISRNVIWVQRLDLLGNPYEVYLNTKITGYSNREVVFNGDACLSIPGISGRTDRRSAVCVEYDKLDGNHYVEVVEGWSYTSCTSIIFQHETDHLNGILFIDRIHENTKLMNTKEYEKFCKLLGEPVIEI